MEEQFASTDILTKENVKQKLKENNCQLTTTSYEYLNSSTKTQNTNQINIYDDSVTNALQAVDDVSVKNLKPGKDIKKVRDLISPYKDLMLVMVKGRKRRQVRLVNPVKESIHNDNCYILISQTELFLWVGKNANVLVKSRAVEIVTKINTTKCFSYKGINGIYEVNSDDLSDLRLHEKFWLQLGYKSIQNVDDSKKNKILNDVDYENFIIKSNKVYVVKGNELLNYNEGWGKPLKYEILNESSVMIFDFGTEIYLWIGRKACMKDKSQGKIFLKTMYNSGYDYTSYQLNPFESLTMKSHFIQANTTRPNWVVAGQLPQDTETILFQAKFSNWPNPFVIITPDINSGKSFDNKTNDNLLEPIDFEKCLSCFPKNPELFVRKRNIQRGGEWEVLDDGLRFRFKVETYNLIIWKIIHNHPVKVENSNNLGQFDSKHSYIIMWEFDIVKLGNFKNKKTCGDLIKVYFVWHGSNTDTVDRTAGATILAIEIDKDRDTHLIIDENLECPAFCRLFDGTMIVYEDLSNPNTIKFFVLRGEIESEAHFVEVQLSSKSLRSRGVFLLINSSNGFGYLWKGENCSNEAYKAALYSLNQLKLKKPQYFLTDSSVSVDISEIKENNEDPGFWKLLGEDKPSKNEYFQSKLSIIRGWHLTSLTRKIQLNEIENPLRPTIDCVNESQAVSLTGIIPAFPLNQSDLYSIPQPVIFVIYTKNHIYIWKGWFPHLYQTRLSKLNKESPLIKIKECTDYENIGTIKAPIKSGCNLSNTNWDIPRNRIAIEIIGLLRSLESFVIKNNISISMVYAGLEPIAFQQLFPKWIINIEARNANLKKGYKLYQEDNANEIIKTYNKEKFTIEELRKRPLPIIVIPSKLENYLSDKDFQKLFSVSRQEYEKLSIQKQNKIRHEVNL